MIVYYTGMIEPLAVRLVPEEERCGTRPMRNLPGADNRRHSPTVLRNGLDSQFSRAERITRNHDVSETVSVGNGTAVAAGTSCVRHGRLLYNRY